MSDKREDVPHAENKGENNGVELGESILELARRILDIPVIKENGTEYPQLILGQLPEELPFEIPFPSPNRIVGTLVRSPDELDIVLDVWESPEDTIDFYELELLANGWYKPYGMEWHGVISPQPLPNLRRMRYCRGPSGPALHIDVASLDVSLSDLRIKLQMQPDRYMCTEPRPWRRPGVSRMPDLQAPEGVSVRSSGGVHGSTSVQASAILETELSTSTLLEHFGAQLKEYWWQLVDSGESELVGWSAWSTRGSEGSSWFALLTLTQPDPGAQARIMLTNAFRLPELQ